jgi:rSAM/selenodomain-associated transferase 1
MTVALVVAKAPVPGEVKTRLAADVGATAAADLAAAALLDTLDACEAVFERCHLSLSGSLAHARSGPEIRWRLRRWTIHPQSGDGLGQRLARAHRDAAASTNEPVVQIGMDTPHATAAYLAEVADAITSRDAVLGPADDGGWWVLALRHPRHANVLCEVPMSSPRTYAATLAALTHADAVVGRARRLNDVDTILDAAAVAAAAPTTRFAAAWGALQ